MIYPVNYKEALKYSMDLCSRQECCRSEITEKLASRKLSPNETDKIILTLEKEKFIDEDRYAGTYTRDKLRLNKWGKVKIRHILRQKKIPEDIVERAMDAIDEEYYSGILREELLKKRKSIRGRNAFELRGRLFRFAQQKGFEAGLIYSMLDDILKNPEV